MVGVKGRTGAKEGNDNARKHGFYSAALMPGEEDFFEEAKTLPIDNEIALLRTRVLRYAKFEAKGGEVSESAKGDVERAIGRLRDMMMAKSLIERNLRETGADTDDDPTGMVATIQRHGAHRTTFKNGKANGNGKSTGQS